ncbi:RNA polymerase sigma factor [Leeuwenhoekiella marinoflava]|uniref:RNA polymerase sigma-70 factor (ECF subfamily) n=2 Tax=Leeuwenhoekiella marinoflava TaxID=988 RepID=A0A4Q0PSI3_9FLAO|nr:sigma-70 family RNA polymerase sigma factor [Leeuwenhoekiella marinoflava]RXG32915.1 RNA polymerase sigma-70 factor (ECF subfamily) [Leeuwenhoekiella marinoflava]SHE31845.1 RNA polymerase sigma-70 factor, ECF subfamily [Leeuwenhoekiella marinoflava DSM 3653]
MSQEQLIKDCKKKKPKAQEELYRRYSRTLFSVALKYARNYSEAEDILQESFITIFNKVEQFKFKGSFEGWLKRIVINTALQRYRKQSVFELVNEENIEQVEVEVDEDEISLEFLLQIVQELPDRYRLVFNLYALDGYSHKDIAQMLKISEGTSKSNLSRARIILKEKVENFQKDTTLQASTP